MTSAEAGVASVTAGRPLSASVPCERLPGRIHQRPGRRSPAAMQDGVMNRPLIGITTYHQSASWGRWHEVDATILPAAYTEAVRAGGGTAMLIPPLGPADSAATIVSRLDGLLLSGGSDVNPSRYGAEPHPATTGWRDDRDVSEMALVQAADDIGLPLLGICRGMQIMAVAAGGTLIPVS